MNELIAENARYRLCELSPFSDLTFIFVIVLKRNLKVIDPACSEYFFFDLRAVTLECSAYYRIQVG